jgi:hypothetical protein
MSIFTTFFCPFTANLKRSPSGDTCCSVWVGANIQLRSNLSNTRSTGFLFRAHPTLMTEDNSAAMMDAIFESPDVEAKARLLKIMQDFLSSESLKHVSREKGES